MGSVHKLLVQAATAKTPIFAFVPLFCCHYIRLGSANRGTCFLITRFLDMLSRFRMWLKVAQTATKSNCHPLIVIVLPFYKVLVLSCSRNPHSNLSPGPVCSLALFTQTTTKSNCHTLIAKRTDGVRQSFLRVFLMWRLKLSGLLLLLLLLTSLRSWVQNPTFTLLTISPSSSSSSSSSSFTSSSFTSSFTSFTSSSSFTSFFLSFFCFFSFASTD